MASSVAYREEVRGITLKGTIRPYCRVFMVYHKEAAATTAAAVPGGIRQRV